MNILDLKTNQSAEITNVHSKYNRFVKVAEAMGLRKGQQVRLSGRSGRNLILSMGGAKIIIDREIAKEIEIR